MCKQNLRKHMVHVQTPTCLRKNLPRALIPVVRTFPKRRWPFLNGWIRFPSQNRMPYLWCARRWLNHKPLKVRNFKIAEFQVVGVSLEDFSAPIPPHNCRYCRVFLFPGFLLFVSGLNATVDGSTTWDVKTL